MQRAQSNAKQLGCYGFSLFGRIAQRESARFTRERSSVRSQVRPLTSPLRRKRDSAALRWQPGKRSSVRGHPVVTTLCGIAGDPPSLGVAANRFLAGFLHPLQDRAGANERQHLWSSRCDCRGDAPGRCCRRLGDRRLSWSAGSARELASSRSVPRQWGRSRSLLQSSLGAVATGHLACQLRDVTLLSRLGSGFPSRRAPSTPPRRHARGLCVLARAVAPRNTTWRRPTKLRSSPLALLRLRQRWL